MQKNNINFLAPLLMLVFVGILYGMLTSLPFTLQFSLVGLMALSILLMFYWKHLKSVLLIFGIFLLLEPLITLNLEDVNSTLALGVKRLPEALILMFFILMTIEQILKQKPFVKSNIYLPLSVLILLGVTSSIREKVSPFVAGSGLFLMVQGFLLFVIMSHLDYEEDDIKKWFHAFLCVGIVIFLLGLVDLCFTSEFRNLLNTGHTDYRFGFLSVQSVFLHPGTFGRTMAMLGLYCLAFFTTLHRRKYLFLSFLFLGGVLLSARIKPVIGIIGSIVLTSTLISGKYSKKLAIGLAVLGLILCISVILFPNEIVGFITERTERFIVDPDPQENARLALYETSLRMAKDYFPLGAGFGQFGGWISTLYYSPIYYKYNLNSVYGLRPGPTTFTMDTHWPYVLGEAGFFGLILYILVIFYLAKATLSYFRRMDSFFLKAFSLGLFMVLIESCLEAFANPTFQSSMGCYFTFGAIGMLSAVSKKQRFVAN